jgi:hypothetical protein
VSQIETSEELRRILRLIERSILPRAITVQAGGRQIQFEVSAQKLLLCPWSGGTYLVDSHLKAEAPEAWEVLSRGGEAVRNNPGVLEAARDALLRHSGRVLASLAAGGDALKCSVHACRPASRAASGSRLPGFSAAELTSALSEPAAVQPPPPPPPVSVPEPVLHIPATALEPEPARAGQVAAFYRAVAPAIPDAWLFGASGQPEGSPARGGKPEDLAEMAKTVPPAQEWLELLDEPGGGPVMAVFFEPSQQGLRCFAIDAGHVVLLSGTAIELGPILAGWRSAQRHTGGS